MADPKKRYFEQNISRQAARGAVNYPFLKQIAPIVASSITVVSGTPTGTVADIQVEGDGNDYSIAELSATPGYDFVIKFTGVLFFNFMRVIGAYDGSTSHSSVIQLYNHVLTRYETRQIMPHFPTYNLAAGNDVVGVYECKVEDCVKYVSGLNEVWMRFAHPMAGNPAHDIHICYASIY